MGWLIDPIEKKVYVSLPNTPTQTLDDPQTIFGAPILRGLVLDMKQLWE